MIEKKLPDGRILLVPENLTESDLERINNEKLRSELWSTILNYLSALGITLKENDISNIIIPKDRPDPAIIHILEKDIIAILKNDCGIKFKTEEKEPINYFGGYSRTWKSEQKGKHNEQTEND